MSASVNRTITEISDWLSAHVRMLDDAGERCQAIVKRLREAGLPVARFMVAVRSLHPQADGFSAVWEEGKDMVFRECTVPPDCEAFLSGAVVVCHETMNEIIGHEIPRRTGEQLDRGSALERHGERRGFSWP